MKKRTFGKLNMVLSTRVALVLALMLALTGCSSAKATPGNPASSGASVGTTSETTTPQSTPSSNASTADAGNDTTPVETSSDVTELAETNQDTPSSSITSGSKNAADYWVSDTEFDLKGYLESYGFKVLDGNVLISARNSSESPWRLDITFQGFLDDDTSSFMVIYGCWYDRPGSYDSITLPTTGQPIKVMDEREMDKSLVDAIIKLMPYSNQQFELGFHLQDLL